MTALYDPPLILDKDDVTDEAADGDLSVSVQTIEDNRLEIGVEWEITCLHPVRCKDNKKVADRPTEASSYLHLAHHK